MIRCIDIGIGTQMYLDDEEYNIPDKFYIDKNGNRDLDDNFEKQLINMMIATIKQLYIDVYA